MPNGNYFLDTYHPEQPQDTGNYFLDKYHKEEPKTEETKSSLLPEWVSSLATKYQEMPSWLEQASAEAKKGAEAYKTGGVPALMADTKPTEALAAGFVPIQTPLKTAPVPEAETLVKAGGDLIEKARNSGLKYDPAAAADAASFVTNKIGRMAKPATAEATFEEINNLYNLSKSKSPIDFSQIHDVRDALETVQHNAARGSSRTAPTDLKVATIAKHALDDWLETPNPAHVVQGDPQEVAETLRDGNITYMAGKQSEGLARREYRASLRAPSANSGMNVGNTIRSNVASMLLSPESRGWSPEIREQAEKVVRGTKPENVLRYGGNELAGGGGPAQLALGTMGGFVSYGLSGGEPISTGIGVGLPMAAGIGLKTAANELAVSHLKRLSEMLRMQAPMSQEISKTYYPGSTGASLAAKQALIRALISSQPPTQ